MKPVGLVGTGVLFLLLGTIAPAYAQHEQQGEEHSKPQPTQQHQQKPHSNSISSKLIDLRNDRNKATAARIMAASSPPAAPMAVSTIAASHNTKGRCAAVSSSLAPARGVTNTALGSNAVATTGTEFLKPASGTTSEGTTSSASTAFRCSS